MTDLEEEDIEALRVLAQSDLRCAKYAQKLLEAFDLDTGNSIQTENESTQSDITPAVDPANESEEGIFAY